MAIFHNLHNESMNPVVETLIIAAPKIIHCYYDGHIEGEIPRKHSSATTHINNNVLLLRPFGMVLLYLGVWRTCKQIINGTIAPLFQITEGPLTVFMAL